MNKFKGSGRYIVIAAFLAISIISVMLIGKISINYNISDYLADDTETKISLNIIRDEFGMTGDIQVMIDDVDVDTAKEIQSVISGIPNVLSVSFNENDENYYKDSKALFTVLVDGDEYSDVANEVLDEIAEELDEEFSVNYGGSVVSKRNLRRAIQSEVVMILAIALALVILLMLLTSGSWLEPFIILLSSGVAVLLNMGTNLLFGEISYITNAVAAILQLALSMDYSIMLLHSYVATKEDESNSARAMMLAIKNVLKPITASALTTMTGLLALLFMTMKIGFDIGSVLMKGILLSAICSLTLLPALLLLFEKPMKKTTKRAIVVSGAKFGKFAVKAGKTIVPIALVVIMLCGFLNTKNTYTFTDSSGDNQAIVDVFGKNNNIIVVYPNKNGDFSGEVNLAEKLLAYKTASGVPVLKSYTSYSNTVRELYDIDMAVQKLNMPRSEVEMLFVMYHLYGDKARVEMSTAEFAEYTEKLAESDEDARGFMGEDTAKTLRTLMAVDNIMKNAHTAEEFYLLATDAMDGSAELPLFAIKQMYGLYFYDKIENKKVFLKDIISFASDTAASGSLGSLVDADTVESLAALSDGIDQLEEQMNAQMSKSEFKAYLADELGVELDESQTSLLYAAYFADKEGVVEDTLPFLKLMNYLVDAGLITDAESLAGVDQLNELYELDVAAFRAQMDKAMTRSEFKAYLADELGVEITDLEVMAIYIGYAADNKIPVQNTIPFLKLMTYLANKGYVTDAESVEMINSINDIYAMDLEGIQAKLDENMTATEFKEYLASEFGVELDESQVKLAYAAYFAEKNDVVGDTIPFLELMNYLVETEQVTDASAIATIEGCNRLMSALPGAYAYDELLPMFKDAIETLTGETVELGFDDSAIQQIYIMYFYDQGAIPLESIVGRDFVDFVVDTAESNSIVSSQISEDTRLKLEDLFAVDAFMSDSAKYDFSGMTDRINALQGEIKSLSAEGDLGMTAVSGVYIKYAISEDLGLDEPIAASDLLGFVVDNMDSNTILSSKMSDEARKKLDGAKAAMQSGEELLIGENYSRMIISVDLPAESAESSEFVAFLVSAVKETLGEDAHVAGEIVSTYDLQVSFDGDNKMISIFTIISIFIIIMILFRSLSLPVVLVATIQGAIWIAMSTSLVAGPMFFMSYIMATCILMGSTIDYGILMSTSYIRNRTLMDKKEALARAVKTAMPTIFTSGLILTICGFVVGFIASQNSISTVGILLGKGTLVSTVMITVVLPSVLYLLDGFILRLSIKSKK